MIRKRIKVILTSVLASRNVFQVFSPEAPPFRPECKQQQKPLGSVSEEINNKYVELWRFSQQKPSKNLLFLQPNTSKQEKHD